jgi:16S rRNA processing protein RimM
MAHPYDPETVVLGVVGKPHGVKGELWLRPHNVHGRSFEGLRTLVLDRAGVRTSYPIVALRPTPDGALVKLAGVDSREAASALTLCQVVVPRAVLPPLAPGEYYVGDVIGCAVVHETGGTLGVVTGTFWNGAQDVMVVVMSGAGTGEPPEEHLIPLLPQFVVTVDASGRKIVVSWDGHE